MELNIKITKENKEKVFRLIGELLEEGAGNEIALGSSSMTEAKKEAPPKRGANYLRIPNGMDNLIEGRVKLDAPDAPRVGNWGQVNSFFPIKAALRILANVLSERNVKSVELKEFVEICIKTFDEGGLNKYRGFPSSKKDTARGRFVWHFLTSAYYMGLIEVTESKLEEKGLPRTLLYWEDIKITITLPGLEFARLKNNVFDGLSSEQVLTEEEKEWVVKYLKRIDAEGFKEYSLLKDVFEFLKQGHNGKDDLWNWFQNDQRFIDYVRSWSRKTATGREEDLRKQISNLSMTYAASKVALLRELKVLENRRNRYKIIGQLDGRDEK